MKGTPRTDLTQVHFHRSKGFFFFGLGADACLRSDGYCNNSCKRSCKRTNGTHIGCFPIWKGRTAALSLSLSLSPFLKFCQKTIHFTRSSVQQQGNRLLFVHLAFLVYGCLGVVGTAFPSSASPQVAMVGLCTYTYIHVIKRDRLDRSGR
ncbi:hypothetical protein F5X96DRAFT_553964 [Biscogniauxia mediterranea]|nr:hypothetical protein F5X96DRAFT_553964 [Biscogniauxia mediterranea]